MGNRPDIIIKNRKEGKNVLIDVAIPTKRNVTRRKKQNVLK
jgi:hypothetical protein